MQLCIPRIDIKYEKDYIFDVLCKLNWGHVNKIYETYSKDDKNYKRILINIDWNDRIEKNNDIKKLLLDGKYINIVHDKSTPFFWRIMQSTCKNN